ncbi:DNA cytosine methyltransferase [Paracoccaceae bacterium]|nr:DNA cytosine methyltransferase [Paracoccaceae bacterium]
MLKQKIEMFDQLEDSRNCDSLVKGHDLETYSIDPKTSEIYRKIKLSSGAVRTSKVEKTDGISSTDISAEFDRSWLTSKSWPMVNNSRGKIRGVDLFSGCGAMSLGVWEACRALQLDFECSFAVDNNASALEVFSRNFSPKHCASDPIQDLFSGELGQELTSNELELKANVGPVDIMVAGPPCQGHSDLNNFTRRSDGRNGLIRFVARAAEVLRPKFLIIENVQGITHDKNRNLDAVKSFLNELSYFVDFGLVPAERLGVPQSRRRFILIASTEIKPNFIQVQRLHRQHAQTFEWACSDLIGLSELTVFDSSAVHADVNQQRMNFLFDNDLYDLPNFMRPDCHRLKKHGYSSVYGRMKWDEPAQTITTGFGSTGQGRFVHPKEARTITPHEACRLQFIPDFFSFGDLGRTMLQKMIGNAVPPKLSYAVALTMLAQREVG